MHGGQRDPSGPTDIDESMDLLYDIVLAAINECG